MKFVVSRELVRVRPESWETNRSVRSGPRYQPWLSLSYHLIGLAVLPTIQGTVSFVLDTKRVIFDYARICLVLYIPKGSLTVGGFWLQGHLKLDHSNVDSEMLWLAVCGSNVKTRVDIMQVVSSLPEELSVELLNSKVMLLLTEFKCTPVTVFCFKR